MKTKKTKRQRILDVLAGIESKAGGEMPVEALDANIWVFNEVMKMRKDMARLFESLGVSVEKSRVEKIEVTNFPEQKVQEFPKKMQVEVLNYPEQKEVKIPSEFSIKKPDWYKEFDSTEIGEYIKQLGLHLQKSMDLSVHEKPERALAVRLTEKTGREFYNAIFSAISGGGALSFSDSNDAPKRALLDDSRRAVVVIQTVALTPASPATAAVTTASASAVAANADRKGLILTNRGPNWVFLGKGAAAANDSGIALSPNGGTYNMTKDDFYTGVFNAKTSIGTSTLCIQEYT